MASTFSQAPFHRLLGAALFVCVGASPSLFAQGGSSAEYELAPLAVSTSRQLADPDVASPLASTWDRGDFDRAMPLTIDALLADDPAFSLYRRETAAFAHPTTQGANLRGLGANAAARALVLLDGIPQNDPFGGWVPWSRYEPVALGAAEILPFMQAAVWGNLSAGGVVAMTSPDVFQDRQRGQLSVGTLGYWDSSLYRSVAQDEWGLAVSGRILRRDGDFLVHPDDRGAIDRRADLKVDSIRVRGGWEPNAQVTFEPTWGYFEEERGNGSPLARNQMRGWDTSLRVSGESTEWNWQALGYYQHRESENRFTALNDDRTDETPVLEQFHIPGEGAGGHLIGETEVADGWGVLVGADARWLEGATHEDYGFGLNNRRMAGGEQWLYGVFAKSLWKLKPDQDLEVTVRGDRWEIVDGFLRERPLAQEGYTTDQDFDDRDGIEGSWSARWAWQFERRWQLQLGGGHAFRLPTINELYRPYRVGSDIFDTNPRLEPERFTTAEIALAGEPEDDLHLETGLFVSRVENVIANVFIESGPGTSPGGPIPADGSYNRRENVDRSRVWGWQNRLAWKPLEEVTVNIAYRWLQSTFRDSDLQPALEDRRFPQVPRHQGNVEIAYQPHLDWTLFSVVRGSTAQYDDPLNNRRIEGYTRTDIGFSWAFQPAWTLVGRVENLLDENILTGIASDGERAIATGRASWLTVRAEF